MIPWDSTKIFKLTFTHMNPVPLDLICYFQSCVMAVNFIWERYCRPLDCSPRNSISR